MFALLTAALLSLAVSGCAQTGPTAAQTDASFRCPSGECQGTNSAGNMGGNHPFQ